MIAPEPGGGFSELNLQCDGAGSAIFFAMPDIGGLKVGDSVIWTSQSADPADIAYNGEYVITSMTYVPAEHQWLVYSSTVGTGYYVGY